MSLYETIMGMIRKPQAVDELSFEMLVSEHALKSKEVQCEFVRRLFPIVFQAALAHCKEVGNNAATEDAVGRLVQAVFIQFAPEFASGAPETILVRFATVIRRKLGDEPFRQIADRYYPQLVVYHITDDEQRRVLSAAYELGLQTNLVQRLAIRFNVSESRCKTILLNANNAYKDVIKRKFDADFLRLATDDVIQK